ncbi:hypothetical protein GQX74_012927 [Glossina fuscipes]|nr:hypothetical protein GQX74_012927 [Glossina fuscipes]
MIWDIWILERYHVLVSRAAKKACIALFFGKHVTATTTITTIIVIVAGSSKYEKKILIKDIFGPGRERIVQKKSVNNYSVVYGLENTDWAWSHLISYLGATSACMEIPLDFNPIKPFPLY